MRTFFIYTLLGLFCFTINSNAQEVKKKRKYKIGIHSTSIGGNDVIRFDRLDGAGSQDGKGFFSFGTSYTYIVSSRTELQTGIEFSKHKITINPAFTGLENDKPSLKENVKLITVPLTLNVNLSRYFFINGGLLVDFEISKKNSIDKQSGIGTVLGIGLKHDFDFGLFILANPYYKMHSLIPFSSEKYHQRLQEYGIKVGIGYSF